MSTIPKTVLITGASSGIGEAAALRLADDGHRLLLGARRTERLEALVGRIEAAGGTASFRRLDVTDPDATRLMADLINDIDVLSAADVAETVAFIAAVPRHVNLTEITILPTQQAV